MVEPEAKGAGFSSAVTTLRKMVTPADIERVIAALPDEVAHMVRFPPLPVAWIPSRHFVALVRTVEKELFDGSADKIADWGRQAIRNDLRTIYKMFIRFLSPTFVIERGPRLWATYARNSGDVTAVVIDGQTCDVLYADMPEVLRWDGYWAYTRGSLRGILEATGMKSIVVETLDGCGAAAHARFRVRWSR